MKNMKRVYLTALVAFSLAAHTEAREFADIYTDCGLGAMIAPTNDAVAAVTNVTWDLGTTAISSNASSEDTCQGGKVETASLIFEAYPEVEQDIARGSGEYLAALFSAAGCDAGSQAQMIGELRSELKELSAQSSYSANMRYENAEKLYNAFQATANKGSCSSV